MSCITPALVPSPEELGFTREITFSVDEKQSLTRGMVTVKAKEQTELLYVALLTPSNRALKIGLSRKSLWNRWTKVVRNMEQPLDRLKSLRPNEISDRRKILAHSAGQKVGIWMTPFPAPSDGRFGSLAQGLSLDQAEVLLDALYAPLFGRALSMRRG